jgi:hypothetical protein
LLARSCRRGLAYGSNRPINDAKANRERCLLPFHDPTEVTMNKFLLGRLLILSIAASFTVSTPYAAAPSVQEGRTAQDRRFVAGGIGLDESEQMKSMARDFTLSITVAARSGAYLADSHVTIQDARGKMVLDTKLGAPYLLVDLASGKYNIEATLQGKKQQHFVDIAEGRRAKIVFSFDVPVDRARENSPNQ